MNTVTSKFTAIVDGKFTGLAGCIGCERDCLRKDRQLQVVLPSFKVMRDNTITCPRFIPNH